MQIDPYLSSSTKFNSKWIKDLNTKPDKLNLIEEKVGNNLELMGTGEDFLCRALLVQVGGSTACLQLSLEDSATFDYISFMTLSALVVVVYYSNGKVKNIPTFTNHRKGKDYNKNYNTNDWYFGESGVLKSSTII
ncbi:hypothetical protein STEG23_007484 [Scotinomys teguina]